MQRYIKQVGGKWYDVYVDFDNENVGRVVDVKITDDMPNIDGHNILYAEQ